MSPDPSNATAAPVENGGFVWKVGGRAASFPSGIPDSEVYLHDDWGDDRLTDREDSETTTYNGEEGIYRPEWTTDRGSPTASGGALQVSDGEGLYTGISLNLSEDVVWEINGLDDSGSGDGNTDGFNVVVFSETNNFVEDSTSASFDNGYVADVNPIDRSELIRLFVFENGSRAEIGRIEERGSVPDDIKVTRESDGTWKIEAGGETEDLGQDTTFTDPQYTGFVTQDGSVDVALDEYKVS